MRYEGPIYRPPSEADSLLIQATVGCPHNKCSFCMVYKKGPQYSVRPVPDIYEDIDEAFEHYGAKVRSIFFPAGNTIAMPTRDLAAICRHSKMKFPKLRRITVYGSSHYIVQKGLPDLNLSGKLPEDKDRLLKAVNQALTWDPSRFRPYFIGTQ